MSSDVLLEEIEVLESIYPTELSKLSERDVQIEAEPDAPVDGVEKLRLILSVHYTDDYPDALPELCLEPVEGMLEEEELSGLLAELRVAGEENLGMAMTFTLVSHLRDQLSTLVRSRAERYKREEMEKERLALEAESARTRGTPVTVESFKAWKATFDRELVLQKTREEEEKLKSLTPKEREEWKKLGTRLTGRQLFERDKHLEEDMLMEEGTVSVDISKYDRTRIEEELERDQDERVTFSDSD